MRGKAFFILESIIAIYFIITFCMFAANSLKWSVWVVFIPIFIFGLTRLGLIIIGWFISITNNLTNWLNDTFKKNESKGNFSDFGN